MPNFVRSVATMWILIVISTPAFSQETESDDTSGRRTGIRAGLNYHWEKNLDSNPDLGLAAGYYMIAPINRFMSWQAGAQFMQFGSTYKTTYESQEVRARINKDYVFGNLSVNITPIKFFDIHAGVMLGGPVIKSLSYRGNGVNESEELPNVTNFDGGIFYGANVWLGKLGLTLEVYQGAVGSYFNSTSNINIKNRSVAVWANYLF